MARVGSYLNAMFVEQGFCFSAFCNRHNGDFNAIFLVFFSEITLRSLKSFIFSKFSGQNIIAKNKNLVIEWQLHP